jgi:hypothetical protein
MHAVLLVCALAVGQTHKGEPMTRGADDTNQPEYLPGAEAAKQSASGHVPESVAMTSIIVGGVVLLLALMSCLGAICFLARHGHIESQWVSRLIGLSILAMLATFLVVMGYSQGQIATVLGFLGTLAGFVLGSQKSEAHTPTPLLPQGNNPPPTTP